MRLRRVLERAEPVKKKIRGTKHRDTKGKAPGNKRISSFFSWPNLTRTS